MTIPYTIMFTKPELDALIKFWKSLMKIRKDFYATPFSRYQDWSEFYERKQNLFNQLKVAIPDIGHVDDAWRYIQSVKPYQLSSAILRYRKNKHEASLLNKPLMLTEG